MDMNYDEIRKAIRKASKVYAYTSLSEEEDVYVQVDKTSLFSHVDEIQERWAHTGPVLFKAFLRKDGNLYID